jgi:hypothetical protein
MLNKFIGMSTDDVIENILNIIYASCRVATIFGT